MIMIIYYNISIELLIYFIIYQNFDVFIVIVPGITGDYNYFLNIYLKSMPLKKDNCFIF